MIYNDLALFTSVARHLSFSEAANALGIPLSRVSRRIAELEDHLGAKLFERTTRTVRLTEEGRRLLDRCQEPFEALQDVAGFSDDGKRHMIRITAPPLAARTSIGPRLLEFAKQNPDVMLDLTTTNTMLDFFRDNIDLAFRLGPLNDSSLIAKRLWSVPYCFVAGIGFLDRNGLCSSVDLHQLLELPAITSGQPWVLAGGETIQPKKVSHSLDDLEVVADAVRKNLGVAMLPRDLASEGLRTLTVKNAAPMSRDMYAVYPSRRLLPVRIRKLIEFLGPA
ncbi:LysR family transcriptional regulator [Rhodobacteraceae bacterium M382]|nr:LysR family transcriptional regulator [Rhodobacteraceae bacterium M382]